MLENQLAKESAYIFIYTEWSLKICKDTAAICMHDLGSIFSMNNNENASLYLAPWSVDIKQNYANLVLIKFEKIIATKRTLITIFKL